MIFHFYVFKMYKFRNDTTKEKQHSYDNLKETNTIDVQIWLVYR